MKADYIVNVNNEIIFINNNKEIIKYINNSFSIKYSKNLAMIVDNKTNLTHIYQCNIDIKTLEDNIENIRPINEVIKFENTQNKYDIFIKENFNVKLPDYNISHSLHFEYELYGNSIYFPYGKSEWNFPIKLVNFSLPSSFLVLPTVIGNIFHEIVHSLEGDVNTENISPLGINIDIIENNTDKKFFGYMPFSSEGFVRDKFYIIKNGNIVDRVSSLCYNSGNIKNGISINIRLPIPRTTHIEIIYNDTIYELKQDPGVYLINARLFPTNIFGILYLSELYVLKGDSIIKIDINKYLNIKCLLKNSKFINLTHFDYNLNNYGFCMKKEYIRSSQHTDLALFLAYDDFIKCIV